MGNFQGCIGGRSPPNFEVAERALRSGDAVCVRASVVEPHFGWGDATHESTGTIVSIDIEEGSAIVNFPTTNGWLCMLIELERVKHSAKKDESFAGRRRASRAPARSPSASNAPSPSAAHQHGATASRSDAVAAAMLSFRAASPTAQRLTLALSFLDVSAPIPAFLLLRWVCAHPKQMDEVAARHDAVRLLLSQQLLIRSSATPCVSQRRENDWMYLIALNAYTPASSEVKIGSELQAVPLQAGDVVERRRGAQGDITEPPAWVRPSDRLVQTWTKGHIVSLDALVVATERELSVDPAAAHVLDGQLTAHQTFPSMFLCEWFELHPLVRTLTSRLRGSMPINATDTESILASLEVIGHAIPGRSELHCNWPRAVDRSCLLAPHIVAVQSVCTKMQQSPNTRTTMQSRRAVTASVAALQQILLNQVLFLTSIFELERALKVTEIVLHLSGAAASMTSTTTSGKPLSGRDDTARARLCPSPECTLARLLSGHIFLLDESYAKAQDQLMIVNATLKAQVTKTTKWEWHHVRCLNDLGFVLLYMGDLERARRRAEEAYVKVNELLRSKDAILQRGKRGWSKMRLNVRVRSGMNQMLHGVKKEGTKVSSPRSNALGAREASGSSSVSDSDTENAAPDEEEQAPAHDADANADAASTHIVGALLSVSGNESEHAPTHPPPSSKQRVRRARRRSAVTLLAPPSPDEIGRSKVEQRSEVVTRRARTARRVQPFHAAAEKKKEKLGTPSPNAREMYPHPCRVRNLMLRALIHAREDTPTAFKEGTARVRVACELTELGRKQYRGRFEHPQLTLTYLKAVEILLQQPEQAELHAAALLVRKANDVEDALVAALPRGRDGASSLVWLSEQVRIATSRIARNNGDLRLAAKLLDKRKLGVSSELERSIARKTVLMETYERGLVCIGLHFKPSLRYVDDLGGIHPLVTARAELAAAEHGMEMWIKSVDAMNLAAAQAKSTGLSDRRKARATGRKSLTSAGRRVSTCAVSDAVRDRSVLKLFGIKAVVIFLDLMLALGFHDGTALTMSKHWHKLVHYKPDLHPSREALLRLALQEVHALHKSIDDLKLTRPMWTSERKILELNALLRVGSVSALVSLAEQQVVLDTPNDCLPKGAGRWRWSHRSITPFCDQIQEE